MDWLLHFDEEVFRAIHVGLSSSYLDPVMWALSYSGLGQVQFLLSLVLLRWDRTKPWVVPLLTTILVSGLMIAQGLKSVIVRDRPSNLPWATPQEQFLHGSFPSGHTTTSFAVATMLVLLTYRTSQRWVGITAIVWASLVGFSRMYRGVHWPTDVLGGACAGAFGSCLVYLILKPGQSSETAVPS